MGYPDIDVDGVTFGLDSETGGLVVYTSKKLRGRTFYIWINRRSSQGKIAVNVVERTINDVKEFAAVFPSLPAGTHTLYTPDSKSRKFTDVTIFGGQVTEVDKRQGFFG